MKMVNAETMTCSPVSPTFTKTSQRVHFFIGFDSDGNEVIKDSNFYFQKLNGKIAFCLDLGKGSHSDYDFHPTIFDSSFGSAFKVRILKRAYQFAINHASERNTTYNGLSGAEVAYMIAQTIIWRVQEGMDTVYINARETRYAIYSLFYSSFGSANLAYCSPTDECMGRFLDASNLKAKADEYVAEFLSNSSEYTGQLAIYKSDVPGAQRLLSPYNCNTEPEEEEEPPTDEECEKSANIPTICNTETTSGYIKDLTSWECIFGDIAVNNTSSEYVSDDTNKYCNLVCKEDIDYYMPPSIQVDQGKYLTINAITNSNGNITPIRFIGTKTCRVTSANNLNSGTVDYDSFTTDLATTNRNVQSTFNEMKNAKRNLELINAAEAREWHDTSQCISDQPTKTLETCRAEVGTDLVGYIDGYCTSDKLNDSNSYCDDYKNHNINGNELIAEIQSYLVNNCINSSYSCTDYVRERVWVTQNHELDWTERSNESNTTKVAKQGEYTTRLENAMRQYGDAVTTRDNTIFAINACTSAIPNGVKYSTFKPNLLFSYEEPVYGTSNLELSSDYSENLDVVYYSNGNSKEDNTTATRGTSQMTVQKLECNTTNGNCSNVATTITKIAWFESTYSITYNYKLADGINQYVDKGTGQSVSSTDLLNDVRSYIDIGFSNLPIHYSTLPSSYNYNIDIETFGVGNKHNDYLLDGSVYECKYKINCDTLIMINDLNTYNQLCGNGNNVTGTGLNVVYRTISLYSKEKAFPGINGTGRTPGDNWNNDTLINTYIINNRGVTDYEVYHLNPMYEIELTPSMMKLFRQYNKEKNREVVTMYSNSSAATSGIAGYSDFSNMTCNSDGTHCVSSLLRGNVTGYTQIKVTGCAISNSGLYGNCGSNNQAW